MAGPFELVKPSLERRDPIDFEQQWFFQILLIFADISIYLSELFKDIIWRQTT